MSNLPRICLTVTGETPEELTDRAFRAASLSGFVELRLDFLEHPQKGPLVVRALRRKRIACIATLRGAAAGGQFQRSAEEQLAILREAGKAGAALVDLELEAAEHLGTAAVKRLRETVPVVLSSHDYQETPQDPSFSLDRIKGFPADYYKLVTLSHSHRDNAAILDLLRSEKEKGRLVAFTLGQIGQPTRLMCLAAGSPFTYASPPEGGLPGVGQIPWEQMCGLYRASRIGPRTKFYGLVGNPVSHSISPTVHNAGFNQLKRDAVYLPLLVEDFADFYAALPSYRLGGVSVTMPHKEAAAASVDSKDRIAAKAGAVNTMVLRRKKWVGYNTDIAGVLNPLQQRIRVRGARVLVAGAGGVARAAVIALAEAGAKVFVTARRLPQAAELASLVRGKVLEPARLQHEQFDVIVHATPLGMTPNVEECFFTPEQLNAPLLLETVYTPMETMLVRMARDRHMEVVLGLEMFLEQAAGQFRLWTGRKAPREVMEQAARATLFAADAL